MFLHEILIKRDGGGGSMECGYSWLRGTWGFTSLFCLLLGRFQILFFFFPKFFIDKSLNTPSALSC